MTNGGPLLAFLPLQALSTMLKITIFNISIGLAFIKIIFMLLPFCPQNKLSFTKEKSIIFWD